MTPVPDNCVGGHSAEFVSRGMDALQRMGLGLDDSYDWNTCVNP